MRRHLISQTALFFYALFGGAGVGLFFGDSCRVFEPFAAAFVDLLQMTVLPYLVLTLIVNVGKQPKSTAWQLARYGLTTLLVLTIVTLLILLIIPGMLPVWKGGSFFSAQTIEPPPELQLLKQYIPANVFRSLAENVVPGVVLFCLAVGIAMIGIPGKEKILEPFEIGCHLLLKISRFIVRLTPLGIFMIAAYTCGTITLEEFGRLQAYVLMQMLGSGLLTFVILPGLITSFTPLSYRQVMGASWNAIITGFATGKVLVTIPIIIDAVHELLDRSQQGSSAADFSSSSETAESLVPLAYVFPHAGRLLALLFIPFAGWFVGQPIGLATTVTVLSVGYLTLFGSPVVAIPYLLSQLQLPDDLFQLFLLSGIYCGRLGDATGVMYMLAFSVLTSAKIHGFFHLNIRRLLTTILVTTVVFLITVPLGRQYLASTLPSYESRLQVIASRHSLTFPSPERVLKVVPEDWPLRDPTRPRQDQILETGELRVGYRPDNLPWSFFNDQGDLVGFDIDMAHVLAQDLGVEPVFVPFQVDTLADQLKRGEFDVAMSGLAVTPDRMLRKSFTEPVLDVTIALVVRDHQRRRFANLPSIASLGSSVRIGVPNDPYFLRTIQRLLPEADLVPLNETRDFFRSNDLDALLTDAEAGSAWTLLYPSYTVVVPQPDVRRMPLAYALARDETELTTVISRWLRFNRDKGVQQQLFDHWILGIDPKGKERRWSILRDVLKWGGSSDKPVGDKPMGDGA